MGTTRVGQKKPNDERFADAIERIADALEKIVKVLEKDIKKK